MKSILVPTDFSEFALFAFDTSLKLARRFGSRVHLLHVLDLPVNWSKMTKLQQAEHPVVLERIDQAEKLMAELHEKASDVNIEIHYVGGKLKEAIQSYVLKNGIELVVMGSHGMSGKSEYFIGSNTQKVVRTVHCPILVVKEPLEDLNFSEVIFASSFNENERQPFLAFKNFIKHFIPKIHLVYIDTASLFDPPYIVNKEAMEDFRVLSKPFSCEIHIFKDLSVERGIRTMAEKLNVGLIGISNHHRHPVKRMLVGSNVEALVNHASLPVLSIDYPLENKKGSMH